jgi:hypothetical protein
MLLTKPEFIVPRKDAKIAKSVGKGAYFFASLGSLHEMHSDFLEIKSMAP